MALRLLTRKAALTGTFIITLVVLTGVLAELRTVQSAGVSMFKVSNISVDETATDDLVAKNRGILKAQKWALRRVFQRLVLREDYHRLPGPKEAVLEQVIRDFEIEGEKFGGGRYIATLTVRFKSHEIRRLLRLEGIPFAATISRPTVVLPIYTVGGTTMLWEEPNPWFSAWARRPEGDGLISIKVPLGDLSDVLEINAEQALRGDQSRLTSIAKKYKAFGTYVVQAAVTVNPGNDSLVINVSRTRYGGGQPKQTRVLRITSAPDIPLQNFLDDVVELVITEIEETWKSENLLRFEFEQRISVHVPLTSLSNWIELRNRLNEIAEIRKVVLTRLSVKSADLDLLFVGVTEQLRVALAQSGVELLYMPSDDTWILNYGGEM